MLKTRPQTKHQNQYKSQFSAPKPRLNKIGGGGGSNARRLLIVNALLLFLFFYPPATHAANPAPTHKSHQLQPLPVQENAPQLHTQSMMAGPGWWAAIILLVVGITWLVVKYRSPEKISYREMVHRIQNE